MRIILYTGKGGVGKTSVAAATAVQAAAAGRRTIILSTDPAHSLGDSLDLPLGAAPRQVAPNLWAQEVDVLREIDTHWGVLQRWVSTLFAWRGVHQVLADEMAILPGMEELAGLLYLLHYHESAEYDTVIVDCAPTGETLRLLSFPEVLRWWMERVFPVERKAARVIGPIARPLFNLPIPDETVFEAAEDIFWRIDRVREILANPAETSVRLVLNPEKMVIKEAQRSHTYLSLYGYATDLIILNRCLPTGVSDPYFAAWRATQERYEQLVHEAFAPLPIRRVPLMDQEVVGTEMLRRMGAAIFGADDPAGLFFTGSPQQVYKENGAYHLSLQLPFVGREDVRLSQSGNELTVQVGSHKRNIVLPNTLAGLQVGGARYEGERLTIRFIAEA
ncbi:MAG: ArsA family ATPase [Chloroflexi bacterium]|nr:ArsA family ATPase [Chloroflexota bacterium]